MAKVTGPLFSMDARNAFGGALVFSAWKGRNVVRQLVTPANPRSAGQEEARNRVRLAGAIQKHINQETDVLSGQTLADKARIQAVTPAGYAWNGFLTDSLIGSGGLVYDAGMTAWGLLTAPEKTAWDDAAAALNVPYAAAIYQTVAGGSAGTPLTVGNAFYMQMYALSQMGLASAPTAVPPTYA